MQDTIFKTVKILKRKGLSEQEALDELNRRTFYRMPQYLKEQIKEEYWRTGGDWEEERHIENTPIEEMS